MAQMPLSPIPQAAAALPDLAPAEVADGAAFQAAMADAMSQTQPGPAAEPPSEGQPAAAEAPAAQGRFTSAAAMTPPDRAKVEAKIKKTSQDFEAMFLGQMLEPMFAGLKTDAPFGGGNAEETWRSFLVQEYAKSVARAGGIGVARMIERQLRDQAGLHDGPKTDETKPVALTPFTPKVPDLPSALRDPTKWSVPGLEVKA